MSGRRARRAHGGGGHGGGSSERWLLTYADLITLLLVFFVVLYALSQVDVAKYEKLKESLNKSMGANSTVIDLKGAGHRENTLLDGGKGVLPHEQLIVPPEQLELERLSTEVEQMAEEAGLADELEATVTSEGLVVSISNAGFFMPGDAGLRPKAVPTLDRIARMLRTFDHTMRIEGHTDNTPISTARYPSNWELSASRATNLVRFLIERHSYEPRRLSAAGYGEYYPKVPNDTEAHRAQNRRVDIVVLRAAQPPVPPSPDTTRY
ncbi:MAG TPA: flagellar motor protein MotB [Pantanalinema sp.]